jgi:hypothetical protein
MKTVVAYLAGVPSAQKSPHKIEVLTRFIDGVNKNGDRGIAHKSSNLISADVGVIQGWVHEGSGNSPHLTVRKNVASKTQNKYTMIVDSNLFNYKDKNHPIYYSRYSMNGVFPTTGNYFWDEINPDRWKQISRDLGITLKDWRTTGNHILICTQRNGGWSMKGLSVTSWLEKTVAEIKRFSDRPIIVRGHPGDKKAKEYLRSVPGRYTVSQNPHILDDFRNAWAVVTYNSSPGVAASIEGIPVFVTDPNPRVSQACEVGNYILANIEKPELKERQSWVEKISMCHWHFGELSDGSAWNHFKKYIG